MSYSNYPAAGGTQQTQPSGDNRKLIYGILIAMLVGTWGYIIYDKSNTKEKMDQMQVQYSNVDSARNVVQAEYNEALARMDSLTGSNTQLSAELTNRKDEIEKIKANIKTELSKKNGDLNAARNMIREMNGKINDLLAQIETLKAQNQQLTVANQTLTTEKDTLSAQKQQVEQNLASTEQAKAHVEDVGSTLQASNINIAGVDVKGSGKEKTTTTAKRVDLFRVSFDILENRISPSGTKTLYVCMYGPDGQPITMPTGGSGNFTTRDESEKIFTNKVDIQYEQGKRTPVSFDWKPEAGKYQTGNYKIEVYQNGYKIGEGVKSLKKGGIFG